MKHLSRTQKTLATLVLVAAVPLGLAACSGGGTTGSTSDAGRASDGIGARWGACMREAGHDVTDPSDEQVRSGTSSAPQGADQQQFERDAASCKRELGLSGQDSAQQQKWEREYAEVASCIRDNGFDDYPEQRPGALDLSPDSYPRASEPGFEQTVQECLAEYSPDTQQQQAG